MDLGPGAQRRRQAIDLRRLRFARDPCANTADGAEVARWSGRRLGIGSSRAGALERREGNGPLVSEHRYKRRRLRCAGRGCAACGKSTAGRETLESVERCSFPKVRPEGEHLRRARQVWRKFVASGLVAAAVSRPTIRPWRSSKGGKSRKGIVHLLNAARRQAPARTSPAINRARPTWRFSSDGSLRLQHRPRHTALRITSVAGRQGSGATRHAARAGSSKIGSPPWPAAPGGPLFGRRRHRRASARLVVRIVSGGSRAARFVAPRCAPNRGGGSFSIEPAAVAGEVLPSLAITRWQGRTMNRDRIAAVWRRRRRESRRRLPTRSASSA